MTDLEFQHAIAQWLFESNHHRYRELSRLHHLQQQLIAYDNGRVDLFWMHNQRILDIEDR